MANGGDAKRGCRGAQLIGSGHFLHELLVRSAFASPQPLNRNRLKCRDGPIPVSACVPSTEYLSKHSTQKLIVLRFSPGGRTEGNVTDGLNYESMYGDGQAHRSHRAPSATVIPSGRGPSQASDFFSARGAPSILEVSIVGRCLRYAFSVSM